MASWFSEHPATSVIGHTLLVAGATWAFSSFVLDENKVNLYKAQAENERTVNRQLEAKISVLEEQQLLLANENSQLKNWLEAEDSSYPALTKKIASLEELLVQAEECPEGGAIRPRLEKDAGHAEQPVTPSRYEYSETFLKGQSFVDPLTNATIGVSDISVDYTAKAFLFIPGQDAKVLEDVSPGASWIFTWQERQFKLTLTTIQWVGNRLAASIVEIE